MVQTLAIRGHYYNGNKVISLLTNLGGNNTKGYDGSKFDYFYYINSKEGKLIVFFKIICSLLNGKLIHY